jgi:hypothetical protein
LGESPRSLNARPKENAMSALRLAAAAGAIAALLAGSSLVSTSAEAGTFLCKGKPSCSKLKQNCAKGWNTYTDPKGTLYGKCDSTFSTGSRGLTSG